MSTREEHCVVFHSPGTFFAETTSRAIASWDVREAVRLASTVTERHGARPYGFVFETYLAHDPVDDGHGGTMEVVPRLLKRSGVHHLNGRLETYDQVATRNKPDETILRSNMRGNGMWIVCITTNSYRSTQPFREEDFLVDNHGRVTARGDDPQHVAYRKRCAELHREHVL